MDNLYSYFLKYSDKINFLTIKNFKIENKEYKYLDLPVNSEILIQNIKANKFENEVSIRYFVEGIILLNAINPKFKNIEILNNFLKQCNVDLVNFVKLKLNFSKQNFETILYNLLLLRGLIILEEKDDFIIKLYINHLIIILDFIDNNFKKIFLNEIRVELSKSFLKDENDSFINMMYGDLYLKEKCYIKSELFYKKSLKFTNNKKFKELLCKKISEIKNKVDIENLLELIEKFRYDKAIHILTHIDQSKLDKEDCYWIAYSYNKLNEKKLSIKYYEKSLKLNADFLNLFIELGILYYETNEIQKSLKIFEKGLKIYVDDEKLLFNKIVLELKLKLFEKAKKDIDKILLYEDLDNAIMNDILYLKCLYERELN